MFHKQFYCSFYFGRHGYIQHALLNFLTLFRSSRLEVFLTLKLLGGGQSDALSFFPENFMEIPPVVQKI